MSVLQKRVFAVLLTTIAVIVHLVTALPQFSFEVERPNGSGGGDQKDECFRAADCVIGLNSTDPEYDAYCNEGRCVYICDHFCGLFADVSSTILKHNVK